MAKQSTQKSGLEVNEDRPWQERFWTVQRVAWIAMALIIVATLLGATGKGGPLASASAQMPGGTIDYPRITRWQSTEQVTVRLAPSASGKVTIALSPDFVELFSIESIEPQPSKVETAADAHRFTFDVGGGGGEKLITFHVRADNPRLLEEIDARIGNGPVARLQLTVLP